MKRLSYIEEARCLKVNFTKVPSSVSCFVSVLLLNALIFIRPFGIPLTCITCTLRANPTFLRAQVRVIKSRMKWDGHLASITKYYMKILLRDFNAKLGREDIFKPIIGQESLHQDSNDNGVRLVNFATLKNLVVKSTMFPHRNIHKYTWTSPDGKTHNQIDHVLIDRRWHSSVLDVRSFRELIVI